MHGSCIKIKSFDLLITIAIKRIIFHTPKQKLHKNLKMVLYPRAYLVVFTQ
jgi:hypothetical protein